MRSPSYVRFSNRKSRSNMFINRLSLALVFIVALTARAEEPVDIGTRLEPLIDDYLIANLHNVKQTLHEPIRREVAIVNDSPREGISGPRLCVLEREPIGYDSFENQGVTNHCQSYFNSQPRHQTRSCRTRSNEKRS